MNPDELPPEPEPRETDLDKLRSGEERFARLKREGYEIYMRNSREMFAERSGPMLVPDPPTKKRKRKTDDTGNALFGM